MGEERRFSREFKLAALARMEAGENVSALARELDVRRKYLYQWRDRFRAGGIDFVVMVARLVLVVGVGRNHRCCRPLFCHAPEACQRALAVN